jgi:D-threo-aldose 1-dehydrogenase
MNEPLPFYRPLPDGRAISAASFGCSSLWAKPSLDQGLAMQILEAAQEGGLNYFDTGPSYGNGEGERRLGTFLATRAAPNLLISTKVGTGFDERGARTRSFSPSVMEKLFTESLSRLGRQQVDILYLHGPSLGDLNEEVLKFLETEKRRGRTVWSGVNSFDQRVLEACATLPIDALMVQYNLSDQRVEPLLGKFRARGQIVISGTALARAIYAPKTFLPTSRAKLWYLLRALKTDPLFALKGLRLSRSIEKIGESGPRAAMRFVAGHPMIHSATFGTTSVAHMRANIEAAKDPMPPELRQLFRP